MVSTPWQGSKIAKFRLQAKGAFYRGDAPSPTNTCAPSFSLHSGPSRPHTYENNSGPSQGIGSKPPAQHASQAGGDPLCLCEMREEKKAFLY